MVDGERMDSPVIASATAADWVREQLEYLKRTNELVRSVPLVSLLGEGYVSPWNLESALVTYHDAILAYADESERFMAALVVPLSVVGELEPTPPQPESLDLDLAQPPALYLFDRRFFGGRFNDFEEYRVPVPPSVRDVPHGKVHAYYTCYRDPVARVNNWEYSRAIWHQHFPDA